MEELSDPQDPFKVPSCEIPIESNDLQESSQQFQLNQFLQKLDRVTVMSTETFADQTN